MLTFRRLVEVLDYDSDTGVFVWKIGHKMKGKVAGSVRPDGYIQIRVDGKLYLAHRLAWKYENGEFPTGEIDHADRDRSNNSFANLRKATSSQNKHNQGKGQKNTSGFKGVSFFKRTGRWRAQIKLNNRNYTIGYFKTPEEASEAYRKAADRLHRDYARYE